MMPTPRGFAGFVLVASAAVLGAALLSQYWGGLSPCELCLLQRWPWWVAIALATAAWLLGDKLSFPFVALVLVLVFFVSAGLAAYHVGVELHWFRGPIACTATVSGTITTIEDLKRQLLAAPVPMCDQVQWSLFGLSLAAWNFLASLILPPSSSAPPPWLSPPRR